MQPCYAGTAPIGIRQACRPSHRVADALTSHEWVEDIHGAPSVPAIAEFLQLWERLDGTTLSAEPDTFAWRLGVAGRYSSRATYAAFFFGGEFAPCADVIWASDVPLEIKIFSWLAVRNRLWTADRLARRNLPNTTQCQLCCQVDEDATHMLLGCVFAREVWYNILLPLRLHRFTPDGTVPLSEWWPSITRAVPPRHRRGMNTTIAATLRFIWLERNSRVFDRKASLSAHTVNKIKVELDLWSRAKVEGGRIFQVH